MTKKLTIAAGVLLLTAAISLALNWYSTERRAASMLDREFQTGDARVLLQVSALEEAVSHDSETVTISYEISALGENLQLHSPMFGKCQVTYNPLLGSGAGTAGSGFLEVSAPEIAGRTISKGKPVAGKIKIPLTPIPSKHSVVRIKLKLWDSAVKSREREWASNQIVLPVK